MSNHTKLYEAMQDGLYGPDPLERQLNKEKLKTALRQAEQLVDSGRLGAIIITEIVEPGANRVMAVPFGDQRVVLQSCQMVMREAHARAARDMAKDMSELQGIAAAASDEPFVSGIR
jgi:hypothetical protein